MPQNNNHFHFHIPLYGVFFLVRLMQHSRRGSPRLRHLSDRQIRRRYAKLARRMVVQSQAPTATWRSFWHEVNWKAGRRLQRNLSYQTRLATLRYRWRTR